MRRYGGRYGYAVGKSVPPLPPSLPPQINTHPIIGPLVALMKRDVQDFISEVRQMMCGDTVTSDLPVARKMLLLIQMH